MCGIVGAVTVKNNASEIALTSLKKLAYRGYDSAGIAFFTTKKELCCVKALGNIANLTKKVAARKSKSNLAIAHTRWATHGKINLVNAHPQVRGEIAVVHNGIIENYQDLKAELSARGVKFASETDTEVVAELIYEALHAGAPDLLHAVQRALKRCTGSYSIAVVAKNHPDQIIVSRNRSSIVLGSGPEGNFAASDAIALAGHAKQLQYLEDGDLALLTRDSIKIYNRQLKAVTRKAIPFKVKEHEASQQQYACFTQKEIFEQPEVLTRLFNNYLTKNQVVLYGANHKALNSLLKRVKRVVLTACGSSYYAALAGKAWIEQFAGIGCEVIIASEFVALPPIVTPGTLFIALSQSGETADTLAALTKAGTLPFMATLAICNVAESPLVKGSDFACLTEAGPEIGVATTKVFTAQLAMLLLIAWQIAQLRGQKLSPKLFKELKALPKTVAKTLKLDDAIKKLAQQLASNTQAFYLGRGYDYPIALEGSLKLKEISYLHAEGYPGGELKHGPLALVDKTIPIVALLTSGTFSQKMLSNLHEVHLRKGQLFVFTDHRSTASLPRNWRYCTLPHVSAELMPFIYSVALQLLAYHVARYKKLNVDHPRNLAKALTVE